MTEGFAEGHDQLRALLDAFHAAGLAMRVNCRLVRAMKTAAVVAVCMTQQATLLVVMSNVNRQGPFLLRRCATEAVRRAFAVW